MSSDEKGSHRDYPYNLHLTDLLPVSILKSKNHYSLWVLVQCLLNSRHVQSTYKEQIHNQNWSTIFLQSHCQERHVHRGKEISFEKLQWPPWPRRTTTKDAVERGHPEGLIPPVVMRQEVRTGTNHRHQRLKTPGIPSPRK